MTQTADTKSFMDAMEKLSIGITARDMGETEGFDSTPSVTPARILEPVEKRKVRAQGKGREYFGNENRERQKSDPLHGVKPFPQFGLVLTKRGNKALRQLMVGSILDDEAEFEGGAGIGCANIRARWNDETKLWHEL